MDARPARLALVAGLLVAALGAVGVTSSEEPHLALDALDPWLAVYAIGVLTALGAAPFIFHFRYGATTEDRDRRWELALSAWGALALAAGIGFALLGVALGFSAASASGALAIVGLSACGLVLSGLAMLVLAS